MIGAVIGLVGGLAFAWFFWSHESPRLRREREQREQGNKVMLSGVLREGNETLIQSVTKMVENLTGRPATPTETEELHKLAQVSYSTTLTRIDQIDWRRHGKMADTEPAADPLAPVTDFMHTDVQTFYQIAQESIAFVRKDLEERIRPTPGGGTVSRVDFEHRGLKASFVVIVFAGMFLDAVLHLLLVRRKSRAIAEELDRKIYEVKLEVLGCKDANILALCKKYADARREIVHEKAYFEDYTKPSRKAQTEAENAISLIEKVIDFFDIRKAMVTNV